MSPRGLLSLALAVLLVGIVAGVLRVTGIAKAASEIAAAVLFVVGVVLLLAHLARERGTP